MGILDSIVGQFLGGSTAQGNLLNAVMEMLGNQQSGGLTTLVDKFSQKGLGDIVNSWISTGKNLPITPEQIQQGLGHNTISQLAAKAGVSPEQVTANLSDLLPKVIDKLTPDGKMPEGDIMSMGKDFLKGLLK